MSTLKVLLISGIAFTSMMGSAHASDRTTGAVIGAGLGAVIGHQINGQNGALIGGAIGALAGSQIAVNSNYSANSNYDTRYQASRNRYQQVSYQPVHYRYAPKHTVVHYVPVSVPVYNKRPAHPHGWR